MLERLQIKNYALIDELEISFDKGLSIITGETGAGKSIMLGALSLLLGERADSKMQADKSRKTVIEAEFSGFNSPGLSPDDSPSQPGRPTAHPSVILRREIAPNGRSRAFIDDTPVTLQELKDASSRLLDIHSQHSNLNLNGKDGKMEVIDIMANADQALKNYRETFKSYLKVRKELRDLKEAREKNEERRDLMMYQIEQLNKLAPKRGELQRVERQFEILSEADEIKENLSACHYFLDGGEGAALDRLVQASEALEKLNMATIDPDANSDNALSSRLKSLRVELKDIADSIERIGSEIESNPAQLEATSKRMRDLLDAIRTFKVNDIDELCDLHDELLAGIAELNGDGRGILDKEHQLKLLGKELKKQADILTDVRTRGANEFSKRLTEIAKPLGLPNLRFEARLDHAKLSPDGQDIPEFFVSFNKNGYLQPLAKTASGGELSRLSLCIKSLLAEKTDMPTVIFDEVDTGVSGEIADKMGSMMEFMGKKMQIITITHLPQVAAKGHDHFKVFKRDTQNRTLSGIKLLNPEERVREIASMISGKNLTEASLRAARELLKMEEG